MSFPTINQQQALRQLELLGFKESDRIYLRFFYPSDDPRKDSDKGRKADRLNWSEIESYQRQGRGAYFVINGGGQKNEDVTVGRALFYEHDNLDKELQRELWQVLELPEPTFQVDTGGKSIHSYWVFTEPIPVDAWCELQRDLLEYADGDRSIKNPARVMRIAGAWHISFDESGNRVYNPTQIIAESGQTYSHEELRAAIPSPQVGAGQLPLGEQAVASSVAPSYSEQPQVEPYQLPRHPDQIKIPVPASVPLLECCRKEVRDWVSSGVPKGSGRNKAALEVGLELVAVEQHLLDLGQAKSEDARQLFSEFCQRSGMSASEDEERWKWCAAKKPSPSCGEDGIEACIRGWYWREHIKPSRLQSKHSPTRGQGFGGTQKKVQPLPEIAPLPPSLSLPDQIRSVLARHDQESLQVNALMDLAQQEGRTYRDLELLTRIIRREGEVEEEVVEAIASLATNLHSFRERLDLTRYLEPQFAQLLLDAAAAMPTAPEYLFTPLLSASASCLGTAVRLAVNPGGGYLQPMIFWTGNVSHSGQAKTPPQKVVIQPLADLEAEAHAAYQQDYADYEQDKSGEARPPKRKRYLLSNVTSSVKIRIHSENPRGLLEYIDELVSDYNRLNQYKGGKGDDREQELNFFNGDHANYDRSDARLFLERTAFSKTGTYQWETLGRLMEDEVGFIATGYMARFLLCSIVDAPIRYLDLFKSNDAVIKFQEKLRWLYEELSQLPSADYLLDHQAKVLFEAWNHTLVDAEMHESYFGLSLVYSKIESYTARLALWLHLVNSLLRGEKPQPVVSGETMQQAIEIASFYLGQHKLIHAHNSSSRKLEGMLLKVQTQALKYYARTGEGIGASWIKTRLNGLKSWCVEAIRTTLFKCLAGAGFGRVLGEGSKMIYIPNESRTLAVAGVPDSPQRELGNNHDKRLPTPHSLNSLGGVGERLVEPPIAQTQAAKGLQQPVGEIGTNKFSATNFSAPPVTLAQSDGKNRIDSSQLSAQNNSSPLKSPVNANPPHQTTNQPSPTPDETSNTRVGEPHQNNHQSPTGEAIPQQLEVASEQENVNWLLQFLTSLETATVPNTPLTSFEQVMQLWDEAERRASQCLDQLNRVCVNYFDRLSAALERASWAL